MKRNFLILLFLALCCMNYTYAQQLQVTGKVSDDQGTVPGVTVTVMGTNTSVMTNIDGVFSLTAPTGAVLDLPVSVMHLKR